MWKIEKVEINNYRLLKDFKINFNKKQNKNDLHIIKGGNDTGKTTLLNAINWCLYEDEPHLGKEEKDMPLVSKKSISDNIEQGGKVEVKVEILAKSEEKHKLRFIRLQEYKVHQNDKNPFKEKTEFKIIHTFPNGKNEIVNLPHSAESVKKYIPAHLREFFFFDGEKIKDYFKREKAHQIKTHVYNLSHIDILERIHSRLTDSAADIRRERGKKNPRVDDLNEKYEGHLSKIKELTKICDEAKKNQDKAKDKIDELKRKLIGIPDPNDIQPKIDDKSRLKKQKQEKIDSFQNKKLKLLIHLSTLQNIRKAIGDVNKIILEKKRKGKFPPPYDLDELKHIQNKKHCNLCDRKLDTDALSHVEELISRTTKSSNIAKELKNIQPEINYFEKNIKNFHKELNDFNTIISELEEDVKQLTKDISELEDKLKGHDNKQIRNWHNDLKRWEEIESEAEQIYIDKTAELRNEEKWRDECKKDLDKSQDEEKEAKILSQQNKFCEKAIDAVSKIIDTITKQTKNELEQKTKDYFFDLIWKKETFEDIKIDDDYNVSLIDSDGYSCYGVAGAAVRQFLALSFTLALHQISGFEAQLIIDTPVGRTSGEHRENLAKVIEKVSKNKQIILLFTPDEYLESISSVLDKVASNRYLLSLTDNEDETKLERL